jgi:hypothetical protein
METFNLDSIGHVNLISFSCEDRDRPLGPRYTGSLLSYTYGTPRTPFPMKIVASGGATNRLEAGYCLRWHGPWPRHSKPIVG